MRSAIDPYTDPGIDPERAPGGLVMRVCRDDGIVVLEQTVGPDTVEDVLKNLAEYSGTAASVIEAGTLRAYDGDTGAMLMFYEWFAK